jgi:hypothetical protein
VKLCPAEILFDKQDIQSALNDYMKKNGVIPEDMHLSEIIYEADGGVHPEVVTELKGTLERY